MTCKYDKNKSYNKRNTQQTADHSNNDTEAPNPIKYKHNIIYFK